MKQNSLSALASWILIIGGVTLAYQGLTGIDLMERIFGQTKSLADAAFGIAALALMLQMVGLGKSKLG